MRSTPTGVLLLKAGTLVVGVACIALGLALAVLPGPLTIPPMLLGLHILSREFPWAERLLDRARDSVAEAWAAVRHRPVSSASATAGGLVLAGAALWAVRTYDLLDRGREVVGL